jgi:hypothetical protein
MKITVYISEGDLDPNMTAADSAKSLTNYKEALSEAIESRFPDSDITFQDVSSDSGEFRVTGVENDEEVVEELERIASKIYEAGKFWE